MNALRRLLLLGRSLLFAGGAGETVVAAFMAQNNIDGRTGEGPAGRPADAPVSTVMHSGSHQGLVAANLLRQFGTGVSNLNAVADKVKQDLGFTLQMTALDTDAVTQKAVTQPKSYDIADIEYFAIKKVFPTGVMQPMDAKKIKYADKIVPIFTKGKLTPDAAMAQGATDFSFKAIEWVYGHDAAALAA